MSRISAFLAFLLVGSLGDAPMFATPPADDAPLHQQIDRLLELDTLAPTPDPADDAEFLRRATLDLQGLGPTADEARAFFADRSPQKRVALIDRLLASPRHARHLATTFDVLWMERKTEKNVKAQAWQDYLYQSFLERKPYDRLVGELLAADESQAATQATAKFYYTRAVEPHALTRDIGRLFFGMDMQCNQCHDHPVIDDYKIGDYYGLFAFVNRTYVFTDKKKVPSLAEKPTGEANFKSVFTGESADKVVPRLPRGPEVLEPVFAKGEELAAKPEKDAKPIPKFSRRAALAERAVDGSTELFDRNAVNRLWAHLFGRGLVHPVDLHHPDNPPSHPELLDLLAREFRAHGCDLTYVLRELALTRTYARSSQLPDPKRLNADAAARRLEWCRAELERLSAADTSQTANAKETAKPEKAAESKKTAKKIAAKPASKKPAAAKPADAKPAETKLADAKPAEAKPADAKLAETKPADAKPADDAATVRRRQTLIAARRKSLEEAELTVDYLRLAKTDARQAALAWETLIGFWSDRGDVALLKPLSAESFALNLLQASGAVQVAQQQARDAIAAKKPKEWTAADPADRLRLEEVLVEKQTFGPLQSGMQPFVAIYGDATSEDFAATLNQALFFGNSGAVDGLLKPSAGNLVQRLLKLDDVSDLAEELYLSIFARLPDDDERRAVGAFLDGRQDRDAAVREMAWGLMSSAEFRFNH